MRPRGVLSCTLLSLLLACARSKPSDEAYGLLAKALHKKLDAEKDAVVKAFKSLASAQKAFKGLDGAAHETYQRMKATEEIDTNVAGRAQRSAARAGAAADALGACELCELVEDPSIEVEGREVILNTTETVDGVSFRMLVLYEEDYDGGSGLEHGGILDAPTRRAKGRFLVAVGANESLGKTLQTLHKKPQRVHMAQGLVASEVASVQPTLYKAAGSLLESIEDSLRAHNSSAVHFVGRSMGGGVACLAACILDGSLPLPKGNSPKETEEDGDDEDDPTATNTTTLCGLGKGRVSATVLGAPPSMSANVPCDFVTSIVNGDDMISRTSRDSLERLLTRTRKSLSTSGIPGLKQVGWMTDAFSLATSNLKSHAHGSEGEEGRLAVAGRAFLVKPRRLGDSCSMHEIGNQLKGGREALRAAVLWQLNDILLSKSMWKHHQLEAYIQDIDRIRLRGIDDDGDDEEQDL